MAASGPSTATAPVAAPPCPSCSQPLVQVEHDPAQGIDTCTRCGAVLPDSATAQLQVLGRVLEDEDGEYGRTVLLSRRQTYAGAHIGQDKQTLYHRKRQAAAFIEIKRKLNKYGIAGLFERVVTLLDMLRKHTNVTWGPRTNLLSTACIYIAAREGKKRVGLAELASDSDLSQTTLARTVHTTKMWLQIKVEEVDPIMFLEMPLVHLSTIFQQAKPPALATDMEWSRATIDFVKSLDMSAVRSIATDILSMSTDVEYVGGRRPEGLACAAILVAMEAVAHRLMPSAHELQTELATLTGIKAFTVAERCRELNRIVAQFSKQVPWVKIDLNAHKNTLKPLLVKYTEDIVKFRRSLEYDARQEQSEQERQRLKTQADGDGGADDDGAGAEIDDEAEQQDGQDTPLFERDPLHDAAAATTFMALPREPGAVMLAPRSAMGVKRSRSSTPAQTQGQVDDSSEQPFTKRVKTQYTRDRPGLVKKKAMMGHVVNELALAVCGKRTLSKVEQDASNEKEEKPWTSSKVFPAHSDQVYSIRRQVLAGDSMAIILAGNKGAIGRAKPEDTDRLSRLLWAKRVEDICDDELFDDDELDSLIRSDKEVTKLLKVPKYIEMVQADDEIRREREERQAKREADIAAGRPVAPIQPLGWNKRRRHATLRPSEVQKNALREEAIRQGVALPEKYEPKNDKRRSTSAAPGGSTTLATGPLGQNRKKTRMTDQARLSAQQLMKSLEGGDDDGVDLAMQFESAMFNEGGSGTEGSDESDEDENENDDEGKVHGSLARAGKVKSQTPKVEPQEKKKKVTGRAKKRMIYNRRFVNVTVGIGGKKKGLNTQPEGKSG
ncbi:hypothetical protein ACM66B_005167 [Microbotryomycetes sp. NB124-2]